MTESPRNRPSVSARSVGRAALLSVLCTALIAVAGCTANVQGTGTGSTDTSAAVSACMAGPAVQVNIPESAVTAKPKPSDLSTPRSVVGSYLYWVSFAYRIATSGAATPTMGATEAVRVDSYIQSNLEKKRIVDQSLTKIAFGTSTTEATHTLAPFA